MTKLTIMLCGAALMTAFAGCGGGGGGSSSSAAPAASGGSTGNNVETVEGIATPSSVSVVTAQNANTGG